MPVFFFCVAFIAVITHSFVPFYSEDSTVLMDCGSGVYGQLLRLYGDQTADLLRKLKVIFISHGHCDHHSVSI